MIHAHGLLRRFYGTCPYGCGHVNRAWTRRNAVLERDRHAAVCRWNRFYA